MHEQIAQRRHEVAVERHEAAIEAADASKWWESYDNIVTLAQYMAETHVDVNVIVHMLEKPHHYTDEWVDCQDIRAAEAE